MAKNPLNIENVTKVATWLIVATILVIVVIGVYPYTHLLGIVIGKNALVKATSFGYAKSAASWMGIILYWTAGFTAWAVINIVELFPIFLKRDRDLIRSIVNEFDGKDMAIDEGDSAHVSALKRAYNALPALNLRNARIAAIFAYTIDFCVNIISTPLAKNADEMMFILTTGQFNRLNQNSFLILAVLLFGMETAVKFYLHLSEANRLIQKSQKASKRPQS
jgi:hypothetical protein